MTRLVLFLALLCGAGQAGAAPAPVRVEFWHVFTDAPRREWMQQRAAEFARTHPGTVVVPVPFRNYPETFQALATAARTGKAPALVLISEAGTQLAIDSMLFRPYPRALVQQLGDYWPAVTRYYTVGTQVYGLPFNTSSPVLYANLNLLGRAGKAARPLPDTLEALEHSCEQLGKVRAAARCLTFPVDAWYFEQWAAQQDALWVDGGNGRQRRATQTFLNSAAIERPLSWLKRMNDKGYYVQTGVHEDNAGAVELFLKGKTAFLLTSSSRIGQVMEGGRRGGFSVQVGKMPVPSGSARAGVVVGGSSLWIPRELPTRTAQAAQDFALFLSSTQNLAAWHRLSGYDPLRQSSVDLLKRQGWFRTGEPHTVAFRQLRDTRPTLATQGALFGSFYEVRAVMAACIDRVLAGAEVRKSLDAAKVRADQILQAYNARF